MVIATEPRAPPGVHRPAHRRSSTRTTSSGGSISRARSSPTPSRRPTRAATSATTPCRCRAARSSTRACSCPTRCRPTTRTCPTRASSRRWRSCTSASRPTPSRPGSSRTPIASSPTTARSTRCAATSTGWRRGEASVSSPLYGDDIDKLWPISYEGQSDTACFDNALEFLVMGGYSLPHAAMMLIPEAWAGNPQMDRKRRAFYEYHACLMEPWDGPAAMAFSDGRQIGATLDRNGLRPARYFLTKDDLVVMSSEAGVLPVPEERIVHKWRLQPGKMLLIDLEKGRIISDDELKGEISSSNPYETWLKRTQILVSDLPLPKQRPAAKKSNVALLGSAAGIRLHAGEPEAPDEAHGRDRPGGRRLHGQRHADLGAVVEVEAPAHLLQAELRAGDEPADRLDPRGARHEPRVVHRAAPEHPRPGRHLQAEAARGLSADPDQRGSGAHAPDRRGEGQRVLLDHDRHHLSGG